MNSHEMKEKSSGVPDQEFVNQEKLSLVFKISEENKQHLVDTLYFFMINFTIAHEFGHIVHGHLREREEENSIDEIFRAADSVNEKEKKDRNWNIQLKEYDADSFAVAIQAILFLQQWRDDMKENLSNFDRMFIANYLCFRTFAEKTGRDFTSYMTDDIQKFDHPHPGIRMYYSLIHYFYWMIRFHEMDKDVIAILESGCHAVIAYEKKVLVTEELKECYFSVAFTEKGVQHLMHLHNEWQEWVDYFNKYAYFPIEKMENINNMIILLDENGCFMKK